MHVSFSQHTIQIDRCLMSYSAGGVRTTTAPIVFLHGWGISAEPYQEILSLLARDQFVIAPDLPSFARSSYPDLIPDYQTYAKFLLEFLKTLNFPKVHLIGHSLGGGIASVMAASAPEQVQSLTLVDSTGIPIGSVPEVLLRRAIEMPLQLSLPKLKLQLVDIPQAFLPNLLFNTQNVIQALLLSLEGDLRSWLPLIQAPCLLLWSQKDLTTPMNTAEEFARLIPQAKLVAVEEGYHEWNLLYPE
ncbi:alpha/beta hydrolase, partial [Leptolyngbya sp. FACHB-36]|uniref:alpha/beta fold hydrolase n=1 Tax=Leptolyngbya sp. FACHB-36 TaxID=2692808 RepID=UPI0018EF7B1A